MHAIECHMMQVTYVNNILKVIGGHEGQSYIDNVPLAKFFSNLATINGLFRL